jgi:hypothetical protein
MKTALKNPSANCLRKFKGLQLTFQVVLDADLRQTLGSLARASVLERFALEKVLAQWDLLFEEVGVNVEHNH